MAQLKQLTVLQILLQINTGIWVLCGKIPYIDLSLYKRRRGNVFRHTEGRKKRDFRCRNS